MNSAVQMRYIWIMGTSEDMHNLCVQLTQVKQVFRRGLTMSSLRSSMETPTTGFMSSGTGAIFWRMRAGGTNCQNHAKSRIRELQGLTQSQVSKLSLAEWGCQNSHLKSSFNWHWLHIYLSAAIFQEGFQSNFTTSQGLVSATQMHL